MGVIDDILAKEPEMRTVEFCLDRAVREDLAVAQADLHRTRQALDKVRVGDTERAGELRRRIVDLETLIDELVEQAKAKMIRFTFAALDPEDFDELKGQHQPTEPQKTRARKDKTQVPEWNTDTFPQALVAAACVKVEGPSGASDGLALADVERIWDSRAYNAAERAELFNTALAASMTRTVVDLPKGA